MANPVFADLFVALDIVVMERTPDRSFRVLGTMPDWFITIHTACASGDSADLERAFPFLDHFLAEAARFWRQPGDGCLKSGPCAATDSSGREFHFEVSTVLTQRRIFLLFQLLRDFDKTRTVIQRARERALTLEQIARRRDALGPPIAQLIGQAQTLLETDLSARQKELVENIKAGTEQLATAIAGLAHVAETES